MALFIKRPLLVTGEAGTGKTEVAYAIARQLKLGAPLEFHCKSTGTSHFIVKRNQLAPSVPLTPNVLPPPEHRPKFS
jgi:MoxR-like ATPase